VKVVIDDRLQHGRSSREIVHETWAGLFGVDAANHSGRRAHVVFVAWQGRPSALREPGVRPGQSRKFRSAIARDGERR
jgi:hypothetical protein